MAKVVTPTDDASSQSGTASYYTPKSLSGGYTGSAVDWAAAAKNDWERRRGYAVPGVDTQTSSTVPSPFKGTEQESVGTNDFMDAWKNSKLSAQHNLFDLLGSGDKDLLWEYVNDEALSPYYADIAGNWDAYSKWFDDSMATNVAPDFLNNVDSMAILGNDSSVWNAYADYYNKNNYSLTDGSMLDQDSLDALRAGTAQGMLQTIFKNGGADSFYKLGLDSADFNDLLNSGVVYERAPAAQGLRDETGNQIDLYGINPAYSVGDMTPYRYRSSDPLSGMYDEYGLSFNGADTMAQMLGLQSWRYRPGWTAYSKAQNTENSTSGEGSGDLLGGFFDWLPSGGILSPRDENNNLTYKTPQEQEYFDYPAVNGIDVPSDAQVTYSSDRGQK